jgi:predicted RNA-binding Zn ribbon-like protein
MEGALAMALPATHDFQLIAGSLALDFVNTVGNRLGDDPREYLTDGAALNRWARLAGLPSVSITPRQLDRVREVREELYQLFQAMRRAPRGGASPLASLNARLAAVAPKRQLASRAGVVRWEWAASVRDPDRVLGPVLADAAELLVAGAHPGIRQCDGETCGWLFLDRSRAGRRRWCSMSDCGNRAKVRRHYRRIRLAER